MNTKIRIASFGFKRIFITTLLTGSLLACKTAELSVHQELEKETEIYPVKGRQGSLIGQVLSFGSFRTDKIKRGWTFGYSIPFIVRFNGASEKLSFTQYGSNGQTADVAVVSKFRETELSQLEEYFSISLKYKNYFAGTVKTSDPADNWDFLVHNVDGPGRSLNNKSTVGFIRNGHMRIEISGIRELKGSSSLLTQNEVYGYEYTLNGNIIGAVSTINNGKVWLKRDLSTPLKLLLASVSSGLMLRNSVANQDLI
ncbi:hypothetical protein DYBT9275_02915 [Dyadobacter sp. CECT 9275]|uniref:Lipoprotein n=1 Tax=Dyadobacter helix TaxID=2822344 RepID=A0A916N6A1_9BACT|nr:hypothetical protein [Dyadobacter sp. CECT 9275]CAG5002544.1 hypothetical protein DYBT9275_02915 [Dyadobacter sp. CECT 9275]